MSDSRVEQPAMPADAPEAEHPLWQRFRRLAPLPTIYDDSEEEEKNSALSRRFHRRAPLPVGEGKNEEESGIQESDDYGAWLKRAEQAERRDGRRRRQAGKTDDEVIGCFRDAIQEELELEQSARAYAEAWGGQPPQLYEEGRARSRSPRIRPTLPEEDLEGPWFYRSLFLQGARLSSIRRGGRRRIGGAKTGSSDAMTTGSL